jgi:adenosylhomocysteine nucleosidase
LNSAGVVAALAAEARTLGSTLPRGGEAYARLPGGMLLAVGGIGEAAAAAAAERLVEAGADALVSWGMAGGLDPSLEAGVVCLPHEVIAPDGTHYPTAREWRETLAPLIAAGHRVARGSLLTSVLPLATVFAKGAAHRNTGAVAVDMESSAVARTARTHGLPFIAVRAIVDTAKDVVPPAVSAASESGQVRIGRLLLGLLRSPADLMPLLRLATRYRAATGSLQAVAALLSGTSPTSAGPTSAGPSPAHARSRPA